MSVGVSDSQNPKDDEYSNFRIYSNTKQWVLRDYWWGITKALQAEQDVPPTPSTSELG